MKLVMCCLASAILMIWAAIYAQEVDGATLACSAPERFGRPANEAEVKAVLARLTEMKLINPAVMLKGEVDGIGKAILALSAVEVGSLTVRACHGQCWILGLEVKGEAALPQPSEVVLIMRIISLYGGGAWKENDCSESFVNPGVAKVWSFTDVTRETVIHITIGNGDHTLYGVKMKQHPKIPGMEV